MAVGACEVAIGRLGVAHAGAAENLARIGVPNQNKVDMRHHLLKRDVHQLAKPTGLPFPECQEGAGGGVEVGEMDRLLAR